MWCSSINALSFAVFHYPELDALDFRSRRFSPLTARVLISNKAVFCLRGTEVHHLEVAWKVPLRHVSNPVVRECRLVIVDQTRGAVFDVEFVTHEEAMLVYFKLVAAVDADNTLAASMSKLRSLNAGRQESEAQLLKDRSAVREESMAAGNTTLTSPGRNLFADPVRVVPRDLVRGPQAGSRRLDRRADKGKEEDQAK